MSDLNSYLSVVKSCVFKRDGSKLASLIALPVHEISIQTSLHDKTIVDRARGINCLSYASSNIGDEGIASITGFRLLALIAMVDKDFKKAYEHELAAYNSTLEYIKEENSNWMLPVLFRVSNDLRLIAIKADIENNSSDFLRNSLETLTKGFTAIAKDRSSVSTPGSKKSGIFAVTNVLFKIYFKVNTLQLCSKLISVVEGPNGANDNLHLYPISDVVMYKYYLGRLKLFEDKYDEARDHLRFALKSTPLHCMNNRQRILASLIPVEMCLGVMPTELIATKYGFHEYLTLGNAVRVGDLRTVEEVLNSYQKSFIRMGIYLALEQVKSIAHRNLFKKVYNLTNSTRLNISSFENVLAWLGEDMGADEIECIIANLIFQNKIKGYISHQKRVLVVSKADAFPSQSVVKRAKKI